jgi:hypothetical protein
MTTLSDEERMKNARFSEIFKKLDDAIDGVRLQELKAEAIELGHLFGNGVGIGNDGALYLIRHATSGNTRDPGPSDNANDGFRVGSIWYYDNRIYLMARWSGTNADWRVIHNSRSAGS